jgi:hypothetical protein
MKLENTVQETKPLTIDVTYSNPVVTLSYNTGYITIAQCVMRVQNC